MTLKAEQRIIVTNSAHLSQSITVGMLGTIEGRSGNHSYQIKLDNLVDIHNLMEDQFILYTGGGKGTDGGFLA